MEIGARAVLAGQVGAEPVVELIANTDAEQHRAVETLLRRVDGRHEVVVVVVEFFDALVGHSDVAAEVPAPEFLDHRDLVFRSEFD